MTPVLIDENRRWDRLWRQLGGRVWGRLGGQIRDRIWGLYGRTLTYDSYID
jgi:hypothetical protein